MRARKLRLAIASVLALATLLFGLGVLVVYDPAARLATTLIWARVLPSEDSMHRVQRTLARILTRSETEDLGSLIDAYNQKRSELNKGRLLRFFAIELTHYSTQTVTFAAPKHVIYITDPSFPLNRSYEVQAAKGAGVKVVKAKLKFLNHEFPGIAYRDSFTDLADYQVIAHGKHSAENVQSSIKSVYDALVTSINDKNEVSYLANSFNDSAETFQTILKDAQLSYKLSKLSFSSLELNVSQQEGVVTVGTVKLSQAGCSVELQLRAVYDKEQQAYKLLGWGEMIAKMCNPPSVVTPRPGSTVQVLQCADCWLAPVDKVRQLRSNYVPANLVGVTIPGGGTMTSAAASAMQAMYNDALAQGVNFKIVSSYRSYATQVNTFENWVQTEMARGYSRPVAEQRANVYSARPGHSEHQLGTTADLSCNSCAAFDNSAGNMAVYNYLAANAHRFGFVISYPVNTQQLTGYQYEPWHVRYIGVDLATQFYGTGYVSGNGNYLAKFLTELGQY